MRRPLVLALPLLTLFALPAAADSGGMHVFRGAHAQHVRHFHHFQRFNVFNRFNPFNPFTPFNTFGNGAFFAPFAWDWGDWEGAPNAGGASGTVIVLNMAPPAPAPAARQAAAEPAIEISHGVTVIRGPGTHHY